MHVVDALLHVVDDTYRTPSISWGIIEMPQGIPGLKWGIVVVDQASVRSAEGTEKVLNQQKANELRDYIQEGRTRSLL